MLLRQMFPTFSRQNRAYGWACQGDAARDFADGDSLGSPPSDHAYLDISHLRGWAVFAKQNSAVRNFVCAVFCLRGPAEIGGCVIGAGPIIVRDLMGRRWTGPMKGFANQAMNGKGGFGAGSGIAQGHVNVAISPINWPQNLPGRADEDQGVDTPPISWGAPAHATQTADLVCRPADNRPPFLGVEIERKLNVTHLASSLSRWSGAARLTGTSARPRYFSGRNAT